MDGNRCGVSTVGEGGLPVLNARNAFLPDDQWNSEVGGSHCPGAANCCDQVAHEQAR